jgi:hypothetical protein
LLAPIPAKDGRQLFGNMRPDWRGAYKPEIANMSKKETETQETVSMATVSLSVPAIISVTVGGKVRSLNLPAIPDSERTRIIGHLIARGLKISLDNPYSTTEGTASDKDAAAHKRLVAIQDGTFTAGGGGGGARLTVEQDAWIEFFKAQGEKTASGKTLTAIQTSKLAASLIAKGKATKEDAIAKATAELPKWVAWMEENNPALKTLIAGKRALANGVMDDGYPG